MFVSINRLKVNPAYAGELEQRFATPRGLENTPGFLRFQLLKRTWSPHGGGDHMEYLAMTEWTTQEAFLEWIRSDAFKQAHSNPNSEMFAAPGEPAGYEIAVEREC